MCIDFSLAECSVPIPIPEKLRKPLTEIQEFNFLADQRALERAEFDKKVITQIVFLIYIALFLLAFSPCDLGYL